LHNFNIFAVSLTLILSMKKSEFLKNSMTFGAITGLALIIVGVIAYILDLQNSTINSFLQYGVMIAGIFLGTRNFRDKINFGSITYGKALGSGVLICLFSSIIMALYNYIFLKYIDPDFIGKLLEMIENEMLKQGLPDNQVEMALEMQRKIMTPTWISIIIIPSLTFMGFLFSLVTSIFLKRKSNPFDEAMREVDDKKQ